MRKPRKESQPAQDWIEYGGRRVFAVDYTEGGVPIGLTEEEMSELEAQAAVYATLSDEELVRLIFTEGDRLPLEFAREVVGRGKRLVPTFARVVQDPANWELEHGGWWSTIHASYLLGAIGGEEVVCPLIDAVKFASDFDCDWTGEAFPSMFRTIGPVALGPLRVLALDRWEGWYVRHSALASMAGAASRDPGLLRETLDFIAGIAADPKELREIRRWAAAVLLDFPCPRHEATVRALLDWELEVFGPSDVERWLKLKEPKLRGYRRNWMDFYSADAIAERQARWEQERLSEEKALEDARRDRPKRPPTRRELRAQLGRHDALAERIRDWIDLEGEQLTPDKLREGATLGQEVGKTLAESPELTEPLNAYLTGEGENELLDWMLRLPKTLSDGGLASEALELCRTFAGVASPEEFLEVRATLLAELGRHGDARGQSKELLERWPDDFFVRYGAGELCSKLGDWGAAEASYREAVALAEDAQDEYDALTHLKEALLKLGRTEEAHEIDERLREADEADDEAFESPSQPTARTRPKLGRNDPCFCGSGKKFKKCCLDKAPEGSA